MTSTELERALDCGDNSCSFAVKKGGMRTNGGCRCFDKHGYGKSAIGAAHKMLPEIIALKSERARLLELLSEAADWVCPHTEAVALWKELKGARREWCSVCSNYLRSEIDATFPERLRKALDAASGVCK